MRTSLVLLALTASAACVPFERTGFYACDDATGSDCFRTSEPNGNYQAIWGPAENDVWAVGTNVLHWDGESWTEVPITGLPPYLDVHGTASDDVWVVGFDGAIFHWNGTSFVETHRGGNSFFRWFAAVRAVSRTEVYAAGSHAELGRWDGSAWTFSVQPQGLISSLYVDPDNGLWALPSFSPPFRLEAGTFVVPDPNAPAGHQALWGNASDSIWSVGGNAEARRWNGSSWVDLGTGLTADVNLQELWGSSEQDLWAVGSGGTVLRWSGEAWAPIPSETTEDLLSVFTLGGDVWVGAAGDSGILRYRR